MDPPSKICRTNGQPSLQSSLLNSSLPRTPIPSLPPVGGYPRHGWISPPPPPHQFPPPELAAALQQASDSQSSSSVSTGWASTANVASFYRQEHPKSPSSQRLHKKQLERQAKEHRIQRPAARGCSRPEPMVGHPVGVPKDSEVDQMPRVQGQRGGRPSSMQGNSHKSQSRQRRYATSSGAGRPAHQQEHYRCVVPEVRDESRSDTITAAVIIPLTMGGMLLTNTLPVA
jgi:hypothetical protein